MGPNTKIQSTRLIKALKTMYESKDLDLETSTTRTVQDCLGRLDFTVMVLMSQVRQLKPSPSLKTKMFRNMSKKEQLGLDLILGKTTFQADALNRTISMGPLPEECLSLVPWQGSKAPEATGQPKNGKKGGGSEGFVSPKSLGEMQSVKIKSALRTSKERSHQDSAVACIPSFEEHFCCSLQCLKSAG